MDNDDEYSRTTDFDMRSHVSGMSVREVLQEPSGLQIHQTKSGSQICEKHQQRTYLPGETGELTSHVNRLASLSSCNFEV